MFGPLVSKKKLHAWKNLCTNVTHLCVFWDPRIPKKRTIKPMTDHVLHLSPQRKLHQAVSYCPDAKQQRPVPTEDRESKPCSCDSPINTIKTIAGNIFSVYIFGKALRPKNLPLPSRISNARLTPLFSGTVFPTALESRCI